MKGKLGEVCGKERQFKTEGGKGPSGKFRTAFLCELCMNVEQLLAKSRARAIRIVRKFQMEA